MKEISTSVESIVIQGGVGKEEKSFSLSDFPSLIILEMGCGAFEKCHSIVFESMNDKMNDEWDLIQLQSITIGEVALYGDLNTLKSNELIMKSMNQSDIGEWWLMIVSELDIPSLTEDGIKMTDDAFSKVKELNSSSMIDWLIMIEMLILLKIVSFSIVVI